MYLLNSQQALKLCLTEKDMNGNLSLIAQEKNRIGWDVIPSNFNLSFIAILDLTPNILYLSNQNRAVGSLPGHS